MSSHENLRRRLKALLNLTTSRGCTEAEAIAAAEKAAELMREHGLSESDLHMDRQASPSRTHGNTVAAQLWPTIAGCTNTAAVVVSDDEGAQVVFFGREPGPQIAVYLRDVCERALDRATRDFQRGTFYRRRRSLKTKREATADFQQGMVARLRVRLAKIFGPQVDRAAIAEARKAADAAYDDPPELKERRAAGRYDAAQVAGWRAGDAVHLGHGVGGDAAPKRIGGAS